MRCCVAIFLLLLLHEPARSAGLTFEKDVRPILKAHCFHCHGEDNETKGGLDVRLAHLLVKGGEHGAAIIPGNAAGSRMLEMLSKGEMPKGKKKLSDASIATIEQWIAQGATTSRPEPEKPGPETAFTDEERSWWAFQPIRTPKVPDIKTAHPGNAIDAFIASRLAESQLTFSPRADAATLLRRITFDLTGLPPTPEETEQFEREFILNPTSAIEHLTDRLLASAAYGERWGRHWLDVAGYADSDGYTTSDPERKHAWKYRDYVIQSLNRDKPFDQFIREQLAGDEIAARENISRNSAKPEQRARYEDLLRATGFLRMAADGTGSMNDVAARNACIADTMKIVSTAIYGMTIGCAQCHDHRYDPISQEDYYRLRAIFEPGFDTKSWRAPSARLVSLQPDDVRASGQKFEDAARKIEAERLKKQEQYIAEVLEKEVAKAPEGIRKELSAAYTTAAAKRTPEQVKLLKDWPRVNQLSSGSLYLYDTTYGTKHADELKKMTEAAAAERAKKPVEEFVQAFNELALKPEAVPATFVFNRGNPEQPKQRVSPGDLSVLAGGRVIDVPAKNARLPSTGRRLAYAESITDGRHPLLARVIVNRVWMQHFGKGLVRSVGDFGALGEKPTHPDLLDWLSANFMRHGWSLKRLHRSIICSETYQQSSRRDTEREKIDPDNRLLSRANVRRLEAETLRDSLLSVSGRLNNRVAGQPVPVMFNEEGQVVIGVDTTDTAGRQTGKFISLNGEEFRRSVYVQIRRTRPLEMFATFDAPAMTDANCEARPVTTVSPQSLLLMNNGYMREAAQFFAARLQAELGDDVRSQCERAFRLAYARTPSMAELDAAVEFVREQVRHYEAHPAKLEHVTGPAEKDDAKPGLLGLAALCHALMSANEFLYVD